MDMEGCGDEWRLRKYCEGGMVEGEKMVESREALGVGSRRGQSHSHSIS